MAATARRAGSSLLQRFFLASTPAGRSGGNRSLLVCNALSNRDPFRNYSTAPVSKDQNVQHKISEGQQQQQKTKDKAGDDVDEDEEFTEEDDFEEEEEEEVRGTPERAAALARSFLDTCYRNYGGNDR